MRRNLPTMLVAVIIAACGTISGDVSARRPETVRQMAGTTMYLVPATVENGATLGRACAGASEWFDRHRSEYARLVSIQRAHADSGGARHATAAASYSDSARALAQAPPDEPDSVAIKLAAKSVTLSDAGEFNFGRAKAGNYFIVIPGLGWTGVTAHHWPVHLPLRLDRLQPSCAVIGEG